MSLTVVLTSQWALLCPFLRVSVRGFNRCNWVYCCYINPMLYSVCSLLPILLLHYQRPEKRVSSSAQTPPPCSYSMCVSVCMSFCVHKNIVHADAAARKHLHHYLLSMIHLDISEVSGEFNK